MIAIALADDPTLVRQGSKSCSLGTAEATAKNQASSIFSKVGMRGRTRAVLRAIEFGLIG